MFTRIYCLPEADRTCLPEYIIYLMEHVYLYASAFGIFLEHLLSRFSFVRARVNGEDSEEEIYHSKKERQLKQRPRILFKHAHHRFVIFLCHNILYSNK